MANGWTPKDVTLNPGQVVLASQTDSVISAPFSITASGSRNIVLAILASSVTAGGGITAELQTGIKGTWFDTKSASITSNGWVFIKLNVEVTTDQQYLPLLDTGRVVVTTGGGGATLTIQQVLLLQGL